MEDQIRRILKATPKREGADRAIDMNFEKSGGSREKRGSSKKSNDLSTWLGDIDQRKR